VNRFALIAAARSGDEAAAVALLDDLGGIIGGVVNGFYAPGLDRDDLTQEARIGAWEAIRGYDTCHDTSFHGFARVCIWRRVAQAVKTATRLKHENVNTAVRVAQVGSETVDAVTLAIDPRADIHRLACARDQLRDLAAAVQTLTPLERHWLTHVVNGGAYAKIGPGGSRVKSAENAIDRARRKLRDAA
jgi:RNA polymerase sporulation-specific sigma factor